MPHHAVVRAAGTAQAAYVVALTVALGYFLVASVWDDVHRRKNNKNSDNKKAR